MGLRGSGKRQPAGNSSSFSQKVSGSMVTGAGCQIPGLLRKRPRGWPKTIWLFCWTVFWIVLNMNIYSTHGFFVVMKCFVLFSKNYYRLTSSSISLHWHAILMFFSRGSKAKGKKAGSQCVSNRCINANKQKLRRLIQPADQLTRLRTSCTIGFKRYNITVHYALVPEIRSGLFA